MFLTAVMYNVDFLLVMNNNHLQILTKAFNYDLQIPCILFRKHANNLLEIVTYIILTLNLTVNELNAYLPCHEFVLYLIKLNSRARIIIIIMIITNCYNPVHPVR
jgi:hypothetical protein